MVQYAHFTKCLYDWVREGGIGKMGRGGDIGKLGGHGLELGREIDKSSGRLVLTHPSCLSPP